MAIIYYSLLETQKHLEEKAAFDRFCALFPDLPKGKITQSESPDFVIKTGKKSVIGIELTRLFAEEPGIIAISHAKRHRLTVSAVQKVIEHKQEKIRLYQKRKPGQLWLVVILENAQGTAVWTIPRNVNKWPIHKGGFDKVFLLDLHGNRCFSLAEA
ncbi:MAG: hypothetical protein KKD74_13905 [Bacteroidetes bacterium]|nr:hypothetical protein [Bacteroidota bacterium]